jgi:hypothetical protein
MLSRACQPNAAGVSMRIRQEDRTYRNPHCLIERSYFSERGSVRILESTMPISTRRFADRALGVSPLARGSDLAWSCYAPKHLTKLRSESRSTMRSGSHTVSAAFCDARTHADCPRSLHPGATNEIGFLDSYRKALSKCCNDPLRPARLSGNEFIAH